MEHVNCSAVVLVGPSETKQLIDGRLTTGNIAQMSFKMDVFNSMSFDVYLVNRQNMRILIPRTRLIQKGKIGFVTGWQMSALVRDEMMKVTTTDDIANSIEVSKIIGKWEREPRGASSMFRSNDEILYLLDEEVLRQKREVYVRDIDCVICTRDVVTRVLHPYSHQAQMLERHKEVREDLAQESGVRRFFTWSIFVIDNAGKIGPRWVNLHGSVFRVKCIVDRNSKDGFWIVRDKPVSDGNDMSVPISDYREKEEDLDFPIYKSYQEALAANETEPIVKLRTLTEERRIKEIELEGRAAKAESERLRLDEELKLFKMRSEEADINHKREMDNLKHQIEQDQLKMRADREKFEREKIQFEHDKINQDQRNAGETIKVVGAVITGVIGLLAIVSKVLK